MIELNQTPLEPLYNTWEEPSHYRVKSETGGSALIKPGRRQSKALLVGYVREQVSLWREAGYPGATQTTKTLLYHWFDTAHPSNFRYHFCQREAVECVVWLYEIAKYRHLSDMFTSLIPEDNKDYDVLVNSITDDEDSWARYCSKVATGGGKTKCMSLIIAWSYFNSIYEDEETFPRHFVLIAPNLIVFDRLIQDFKGDIFTKDPILPPEFANDFSLDVISQDSPGSGTYKGCLYLTNIHRLFEKEKKQLSKNDQTPSWAGPDVKRAQVFKVGEKLRSRIAEHPSVMVINDEAHHLHDPGSAWNDAIRLLNQQSISKGNKGVAIQLDYTATPKHNDGTLFRHIVSEFPLGEAVDAGIVKVPVIGKSAEIKRNELADNAFEEYRSHLIIGYKQYQNAFDEWKETHKPILFVMTENAAKANEITSILNNDDRFPLLKGKVLNLHTRLKGKIVERKIGKKRLKEFVPDERNISDDDLKTLRELSNQLDDPESPYRCVVSVLMLREGWDVKNVTTIVPLRPYSAESNILAEQTLGRGLRRMVTGERLPERVTVVEHEAFTKFYQDELEQEGLDIIVEDLGKSKPQTITIFVDHKNKPVDDLEIEIPFVTDSIEVTAKVDDISFEEINSYFKKRYTPLPIKEKKSGSINFVEKTLFTDEVVNEFKFDRGLLAMGAGAVSVYVRELEKVCKIQGAHSLLAPLISKFIESVLFGKEVSLYSGEVDHRLGDIDVAEHIRAVFTPIIRAKTTNTENRKKLNKGTRLSNWKNFQATRSDNKPCVTAKKTMFNLVTCDRNFEAEFADFLDVCEDVAAFAKNTGPQKLMIDYLKQNGRRSFYNPDFFVKLKDNSYYLVETKGQEDTDVAYKARAAVEWCKTASSSSVKWNYCYIPVPLFEQINDYEFESLASASKPRLKGMLDSLNKNQLELTLDSTQEEIIKEKVDKFLGDVKLDSLPENIRCLFEQSINQLDYDIRLGNRRFNSAFTILLEPFELFCGKLLRNKLEHLVPQNYEDSKHYFNPFLEDLPKNISIQLFKNQRNLERNLTKNGNNNRIGNLIFCMNYPFNPLYCELDVSGIWNDVNKVFDDPKLESLYQKLRDMNQFRNLSVVHMENPITDIAIAEDNLKKWIEGLIELYNLCK